MDARRAGRRLIALAGVLLGVVTVPLALLFAWTWISGGQLQVVRSGSMAPTFEVGSVLLVEPVRASDVEVGDALVFADADLGDRLVTHRVRQIEADADGVRRFVTRGDANRADDPDPVPATAVRGRVTRAVPALGRLLGLVRWPSSGLLFVGLPLLLIAVDALLGRDRQAGTGAEPDPDLVPATA